MLLSKLHIHTPVLDHPAISQRLGLPVYLKMECYQPTGSFKMRGIGQLCQQAVAQGYSHLVSSSGGNAGYAAAYAGRQLGVAVTVIMPTTSSQDARSRIASEGAEVIIHGAVWNEADALAQEMVNTRGAAYIHPFDDAAIWAGHATMIDEAVTQVSKPACVVVAVGGGGLISGVYEGLQRNGWADVPVLAVETEGAASFAASFNAGRLTRISEISSIAKTLGALEVTPRAFEWSQQHPTRSIVVSDYDAVDACLRFLEDQRVLVEPACGAALSLLYRQSQHLQAYESALVIVCGGAGVSLGQLQAWHETLA